MYGKQNKEEESDEEEDEMLEALSISGKDSEQKKPKAPPQPEVKFLEIGSPTATLRILTDLKNIRKQDPQSLGFTASPVKIQDSTTSPDGEEFENLYHWHVKLFNFDKDSEIAKDLDKVAAVTGQDYILLEMKVSHTLEMMIY
jgi:hypothetical protein